MKAALLLSWLLLLAVSASSLSSTQSPTSKPVLAKNANNNSHASHVYYTTKSLSDSTDSELSAMLSVDSKELLVDKLPSGDEETNNEKVSCSFCSLLMSRSQDMLRVGTASCVFYKYIDLIFYGSQLLTRE